MTAPDPTRRRFLAGLAALTAVAAGGGVAWWAASRSPTPATGGPTTTDPGTSTAPASSATSAPSAADSSPATSTTPSTTMSSTAPLIEVIGRDGWGAAPISGELTTHHIERFTVHHTGRLLERNQIAPQRLRRHQIFHQDERGWADLAYHFVIDAAGNVYEGRPVNVAGDTATDYDPVGHLLVCCEGNFDEQTPPDAQIEALAAVLAWGATEHDVGTATIAGHRDYAVTACPGAALDELISDGGIATTVDELIADGRAPSLQVVTGTAARDRVVTIEQG